MINLSDDWRENGPIDDREFDEDGEEIEPVICESCGYRMIGDACNCAEEEK